MRFKFEFFQLQKNKEKVQKSTQNDLLAKLGNLEGSSGDEG